MGFETFVRFEQNPLDPRPYAPGEFLRGLEPSLVCTGEGLVFEYRVEATDPWPAVVISIEADGFLVCENDRRVGARLLGPLVQFAVGHAKDERVIVESA
ncbi:MAG: hypothetical protein IPJ34_25235 [Myxococcales bacterium]|nr:hypothetical protein [Myxococcales bacterium]